MQDIQTQDSELWNQIQEQFNKLKLQSGINPDEDYAKQLEDMFGLTQDDFDEMDRQTEIMLKSKKIKVNMIHDLAVFPKYAYLSDSGFDLHSTIDIVVPPFGRALIPTGLKFSFDEGYEIQVRTKSGLAINQGLIVLNSPGTVDAGYTGECKVPVLNVNQTEFRITAGMKVAQAVLCPVMNGRYVRFENVDDIENKDRGNNGFGSTGI